MQANIIKLYDTMRPDDFGNIKSFRVKVHNSGEFPWVGKNPSSWEKIDAHTVHMSTVALSIQGEKVENRVSDKPRWH